MTKLQMLYIFLDIFHSLVDEKLHEILYLAIDNTVTSYGELNPYVLYEQKEQLLLVKEAMLSEFFSGNYSFSEKQLWVMIISLKDYLTVLEMFADDLNVRTFLIK